LGRLGRPVLPGGPNSFIAKLPFSLYILKLNAIKLPNRRGQFARGQ
jgi:hypothetical protein